MNKKLSVRIAAGEEIDYVDKGRGQKKRKILSWSILQKRILKVDRLRVKNNTNINKKNGGIKSGAELTKKKSDIKGGEIKGKRQKNKKNKRKILNIS